MEIQIGIDFKTWIV